MKWHRTDLLFTLAAFSAALQGCKIEKDPSPALPFNEPVPRLLKKVDHFSDCADLNDWMDSQRASWERFARGAIAYPPETSAPAPSGTLPAYKPNPQVIGIDEPDFVKTIGTHVYYARARSVEVFSAHDLTPIASLNFGGSINLKLLQFGQRLVVIGGGSASVKIAVLKDDGEKIVKEKEFSFQGSLRSAHLNQGMATFVVNSWRGDKPLDIPCEQILKPVFDVSYESAITAVHSLDLTSPTMPSSSIGAIGSADQVYMSNQNLYIVSNGYPWFWWDSRVLADPLYRGSTIRKFKTGSNLQPRFLGVAGISGVARNQLSFHEDASGLFLFAATTFSVPSVNRIWAIKEESSSNNETSLVIAGTSDDFGANEDIRAVHFQDERAYVTTFRTIDPLFVFDLGIPERPRLLSFLELPGFSSYLHSLSPQKLLGAGYSSSLSASTERVSGAQISLFTIDPDGSVTMDMQTKMGGWGSHIEAAHDHHAFTRDEASGMIALPARIMADEPFSDPWSTSTHLEFSGALIIDSSLGTSPVGRLTHSEWVPENCLALLANTSGWSFSLDSVDIRRVLPTDAGLLSLSPFGVKLHDREPPFATRAARAYSDSNQECRLLTYGY